MNFLAHLEVARRRFGDGDTAPLLGAMLPDLISVTSLKVGPLDRWPAAAAAGIECHRRTDEAFHADGRFVTGMAAIRDDLMDVGLARGPARAAAHVAWELLLDGALIGPGQTREAYLRALATPTAAWSPAGDRDELAVWHEVVRRYRERELPVDVTPATVAERVIGLLGRRPRLAVPPGRTGAVTEVLAVHAAAIATVADAVLADTTAVVATPGAGPERASLG